MLNIITNPGTSANGKAKRKEMLGMLLDAIIIAMIATAAVMGNDVPTNTELWVMLKAFLAAFFLQLAVERGIKREKA